MARGPERLAIGAKPRPLDPDSLTGLGAANVTKITAFRFAGTGPERSACDMWLFRNNPLKKITDPFAALSVWTSYVRLCI